MRQPLQPPQLLLANLPVPAQRLLELALLVLVLVLVLVLQVDRRRWLGFWPTGPDLAS